MKTLHERAMDAVDAFRRRIGLDGTNDVVNRLRRLLNNVPLPELGPTQRYRRATFFEDIRTAAQRAEDENTASTTEEP